MDYGINENRIYKLPNDFSHNLYKNLYSDLSYFTDQELELHFLLHGYHEKRVYK